MNTLNNDLILSEPEKKIWSEPTVELISKDSVESGTDTAWAEGTVPPRLTVNYAS